MKIINLKLVLFFSISCILISTPLVNCQNGTINNITNQTIDIIDIKNNTNNVPEVIKPPVKNQTKIQEEDKFNIEIYKSKSQNKSAIGAGYKKYIDFKEDLYRTPFKEFNNKFSPELELYTQRIYNLGSYWFFIAGLSGLLFIVYAVLNTFFGKFKGSKKENLDGDFMFWAWGVFSK